jgi:hypothetical protein
LGHDAVLGVERLHLGLLEVGVQLDLVDGGDDLGLLAGASDNATTAAEDAAPVRCLGQQAVPQIDGPQLG